MFDKPRVLIMRFKPRRLGALLAAGAVLAGTLVATQGGSQADTTSPWPGLPLPEGKSANGGWLGAAQTGLTEAVTAKQWVRLPLTIDAMAANFVTGNGGTGPLGPVASFNNVFVSAWFVSPAGSKQHYGIAPPITVRTVAFGSIPVVATISVRQRLASDGLPLPFTTETPERVYADGSGDLTVDPVVVKDAFDVKVTKLSVDGVGLILTGPCVTAHPAPIDVSSEGFTIPRSVGDGPFDPTKNFYGVKGGTLAGTIDIPAFHGCTTNSGDDVSRLLTASVSGSGNPLTLRVGNTSCMTIVKNVSVPPGPGDDTPAKAHCDPDVTPPAIPPAYSYPAR